MLKTKNGLMIFSYSLLALSRCPGQLLQKRRKPRNKQHRRRRRGRPILTLAHFHASSTNSTARPSEGSLFAHLIAFIHCLVVFHFVFSYFILLIYLSCFLFYFILLVFFSFFLYCCLFYIHILLLYFFHLFICPFMLLTLLYFTSLLSFSFFISLSLFILCVYFDVGALNVYQSTHLFNSLLTCIFSDFPIPANLPVILPT